MDHIINYLKKASVRRILILACLTFILYLLRSMINLLLLTFIFTFLMYSMQNFITRRLRKIIKVKQRMLIALMYIILTLVVFLALYKFFPDLIVQIREVVEQAVNFYEKPHESALEKYLISLSKSIDIAGYAHTGINSIIGYVRDLSKFSFDIFIALILSLFFLLERSRIVKFTVKFKNSKISNIYNEIEYFGKKFINSFGKVIEAQMLISIINSILSVLSLWALGFPQLLTLWAMIFVLGLVPVAGVIVSLLPLCLIAFAIGGYIKVIYVLILIAVLHALESYVLNPKLMSSKTELPVFYTFLILLLSERMFGVWGLIIGIPIFMFFLDLIMDSKPTETER